MTKALTCHESLLLIPAQNGRYKIIDKHVAWTLLRKGDSFAYEADDLLLCLKILKELFFLLLDPFWEVICSESVGHFKYHNCQPLNIRFEFKLANAVLPVMSERWFDFAIVKANKNLKNVEISMQNLALV